MDWNKLLSTKRYGLEDQHQEKNNEIRTQFQRDYDRLIFSSPFRRLQNKTQVFPLPRSVFVHNRLTHSLEVSSVGRSLGNLLAQKLKTDKFVENEDLLDGIGSITAAACLAHDLGNPPFGHSGEKALSHYFNNGKGQNLKVADNQYLKDVVTKSEWKDLTNFEGNANALRLLTHAFKGRRKGGFALTYSTMAATVKYPWGSLSMGKDKKYGFFQSEKQAFGCVAEELGLNRISKNPDIFARHPLVFLVEAADDICYQIMDIEDAHKLKILSTEEVQKLFLNFYDDIEDKKIIDKTTSTFNQVTDINEQIAYLRAGIINKLVNECINVFWNNHKEILKGTFKKSLIENLKGKSKEAYNKCSDVAMNRVYRHRSVIKIELAGYKILGTLLEEFVEAALNPNTFFAKKLLSIIPEQYDISDKTDFQKVQSILDFVSGMTDVFALDLYRTIKGISLPENYSFQ